LALPLPDRLRLPEPLPELILPEPSSDLPEPPGERLERQSRPELNSDLPRLPGEPPEEYILRTDAEEREAIARSRLWVAIAAFDPAAPLDANGQTALQAELREIAVLLDEARQLREFGIVARIEALAEAEGPGSSPEAEGPGSSPEAEGPGSSPEAEGPGS